MQVFVKHKVLRFMEAKAVKSYDGFIEVTGIKDKARRIKTANIHFISKQKSGEYRISYYGVEECSGFTAISSKHVSIGARQFVCFVLKNKDGSAGEKMYYPENHVRIEES